MDPHDFDDPRARLELMYRQAFGHDPPEGWHDDEDLAEQIDARLRLSLRNVLSAVAESGHGERVLSVELFKLLVALAEEEREDLLLSVAAVAVLQAEVKLSEQMGLIIVVPPVDPPGEQKGG